MEVLFVLLSSLSALIVAAIIWYFSKLPPAHIRDRINQMPGPDTVPILGNAHMLRRGGTEFLKQVLRWCNEHGQKGIFRVWVGNHLVVVLNKPDTAEVLLKSSKHMTKSYFYGFLRPWLGTGLLISTGEKWHSRRKLITPTFHFKILEDFLQVFNEQSAVMQKRLESMVGKSQGFDVNPFVTLCALDIICDTAMGKHVNAQGNSDSDYVKAIYTISELVMERIKRPWLWPSFIFNILPAGREQKRCLKILHEFTNKVIEQRRAEFERQRKTDGAEATTADRPILIGGRKRLAFLDMLLHSSTQQKLTTEDIREEVDTFMFEGHDTTSTSISWSVHLIGDNPKVQEKLFEEIDGIFGQSDRPVTMDDIKQLKYLDCVIKEALRLFPSVPMFAREFSEDCEINGMFVPKGATAVIVPSAIHRDPVYYPEPDEFNPDRWLTENSAGHHPFCYIPFSAGLRNCIGQKFAMIEEKVMISSILRKFRITSLQTRSQLVPCADLILRSDNGIMVRLDKRFP